MLIEALVFNGDGGVDQILGNILKVGPFPVVLRENILELLDIAVGIQIIDIGVQIALRLIPVSGQVGQNLFFHIVTHGTGQHHKAQADDDQHRAHSAQGNLDGAEGRTNDPADQTEQPVGMPLLAGRFLFFLKECHSIPSNAGPKSSGWSKIVSRRGTFPMLPDIIAYPIQKRKTQFINKR